MVPQYRLWFLALPLLILSADAAAEDAGAVEDGSAEDASAMDSAAEDGSSEDGSSEDGPSEDGSSEDGSVTGCGLLDYIGRCTGDVLTYCSQDQIQQVDCRQQYSAAATCGLLDCTDPDAGCLGYSCVGTAGATCTGPGTLSCDVTSHGCQNGVCAASTPCDEQTFVPSCSGTQRTFCLFTVQDEDCSVSSHGSNAPYTCETVGNQGYCLGTQGGRCHTDLDNADLDNACATGFTCLSGSCTAIVQTDGGSATDSKAKKETAEGMNCQGYSPTVAWPLVLSLLYPMLRRVRRP